jgi:hypothetical protein
MLHHLSLLIVVFVLFTPVPRDCQANRASWSPKVITFGKERQALRNTPVVMRPNRPFHFYGNAVRRRHYKGRTSIRR